MTVRDIFIKVSDIDRLRDLCKMDSLTADDFNALIDLIEEYRDELLNKTVK